MVKQWAERLKAAGLKGMTEMVQEAMRASVYDMAGQRCFYDIHHLCGGGGSRSLYLVVFDLRCPLLEKAIDLHDPEEALQLDALWAAVPNPEGDSLLQIARGRIKSIHGNSREKACLEKICRKLEGSVYTNLDRIHYWLTSVNGISPEASILVVGTHRDSLSEEATRQKCKCVQESWFDKPYRAQVIGEILTVESSPSATRAIPGTDLDNRSGIAHLRRAIEQASQRLPGMQEEYPLVWLHMLRWAREQVSQGHCRVRRDEFAAAAKVSRN